MKPNKRQISETLLKMLDKGGVYDEITELVKTDPYLDMEMRGDTGVIVYYRGGKILTIDEKKGLSGLDKKYYRGKKVETVTPSINNIFEYICKSKHIIDLYEREVKNKLGEKEIQQRVVYENNLSVNANNTDYFVADIEWEDNNLFGGRADIVAFRWNHMEHRKRLLQLTIIEVKQGEKAVKTQEDGNPGLKKHYEDYQAFIQDKDYISHFIDDMLAVLYQKYKLGIIKGLDKLYSNGKKSFTPKTEENIDFVFLLANYHHYSDELKEEFALLPDDCKFYVASFMGYGLYKDFIFNKNGIQNLFPNVFNHHHPSQN